MDSCRELFKTIEILPFYSQYISSLVLYVENKKHLFTQNLEDHNHDARSAKNFHLPITNLTKYQKAAHFAGIKIFKSALKRFLLSNSFYSNEEYFNSNK